MEELKSTAEIAFKNFEDEKKTQILEDYSSFNGEIAPAALKMYLIGKNRRALAESNIYSQLTSQGNPFGWKEFLTVCYMIDVGWPVCNHCRDVPIAAFYVCLSCELAKGSYKLCPRCRGNEKFQHEHTNFVDNFHVAAMISEANASSSQTANETASKPEERKRDKVKKFWKIFDDLPDIWNCFCSCVEEVQE